MDWGGSVISPAPGAAVSSEQDNELASVCCETGSLLCTSSPLHTSPQTTEKMKKWILRFEIIPLFLVLWEDFAALFYFFTLNPKGEACPRETINISS